MSLLKTNLPRYLRLFRLEVAILIAYMFRLR
jgi:hypothetical protein